MGAVQTAFASPKPPKHSPEDQEPVFFQIRKLAGDCIEVQGCKGEEVSQLRKTVAKQLGTRTSCVQLLQGTEVLKDRTLLRELEAELVVLLRPGAPDWADELGFDGDFGAHLRDYWAKHGQDQPDWLADENEVWDRLKKAGEANVDRRDRLEGWNHHVQISQDGQPAGTLRASCGQKLDLTASGWIQNNRGDSCIHQLMLVLDTSIVAELYDSVPGRNRPVNKNFSLVAPDAPGIYMLWRASDLQYSMRDARRNLENSHTRPNPAKFPGSFVAWLVVE